MSDRVKIAVIIAVGVVLAVGLQIYFSPYQTCLRSFPDGFAYDREGRRMGNATVACAQVINSN